MLIAENTTQHINFSHKTLKYMKLKVYLTAVQTNTKFQTQKNLKIDRNMLHRIFFCQTNCVSIL